MSDWTIEHFKARLVAKWYAQKAGMDYDKTFSPVVKFQAIQVVLALAVQHDLLLHQMDVVIEETIYMQQPDGYIQHGKQHLICKLNESLYALKQSPKCYVFTEFMKSVGFTQSPCIYWRYRHTKNCSCICGWFHRSNQDKEMQEVNQQLQSQFKMKDLGELHYCLGITISYDQTDSRCIRTNTSWRCSTYMVW